MNCNSKQRITGDQVYQILLVFDKMYGEFSDLEKKRFMQTFIEQVDIYPQKQESGQILKNIKFKFPIYFQVEEVDMFSWDGENTAETVVLLSKKHVNQNDYVEIGVDVEDYYKIKNAKTQ